MHGYDMMWGWGGMWFHPVVMILLGVVAVVLIVWLIRAIAGKNPKSSSAESSGSSARLILDERYAKGEIDDEDYRRRRAALES